MAPSTRLKAETEGLIIAAQDQSLPKSLILQELLRRHQSTVQDMPQAEETVDHIISGCPELPKTDYLEAQIRQLHISIGRSAALRY